MARKVYIRVLAEFDEAGNLLPRSLTWEDGRQYVVERVLNVCHGVSLKVGGSGMRYTCRIQGRQVYLFRDEDRWYMEGRDEMAT